MRKSAIFTSFSVHSWVLFAAATVLAGSLGCSSSTSSSDAGGNTGSTAGVSGSGTGNGGSAGAATAGSQSVAGAATGGTGGAAQGGAAGDASTPPASAECADKGCGAMCAPGKYCDRDHVCGGAPKCR